MDFFDVCAPPVLSNTTFGLERRSEVDSADELTTGSDVTPDAEAGSEVEPTGAGSEVEPTGAEPEVEDNEPDVEPCEPDEDVEPVSDGSASATPGLFAIPAPTPSATANAPTRPMYIAVAMMVPSPVESDADNPSTAPMSHVVR